jgi:hypothetical protein
VGSMVYALIVLASGSTQDMILVGNLHWLIQTAHLLVGIGAMAVALVIDKRYRHLRLVGLEEKREGTEAEMPLIVLGESRFPRA